MSRCGWASTMATTQVVQLDSNVRAIVDRHKPWLLSTTFRPFQSTIEICSNEYEMKLYGEGLVHDFRSQFWKVHMSMLLERGTDIVKIDENDQPIDERRVIAIRFASADELPVEAGVSCDIIPVSGPILVNDILVRVGFYGHIDQTSRIRAISPPLEPIRHCWLYMSRNS